MIGKKVKLYIATGIGNTTCLVGGRWKENNSLGREQCSSWEVQGKKCPHPGSRYDVAQCPHTVVSTLKLPVISRNMARITNLSPFPKTLPRRRLVETSGVAQVNEPPSPCKTPISTPGCLFKPRFCGHRGNRKTGRLAVGPQCYRLNVCVQSKFLWRSSDFQWGGIWRGCFRSN